MTGAITLIEAEGLEVSPDLFPEISAHQLASVQSPFRMVESPEEPGLGIEINPASRD